MTSRSQISPPSSTKRSREDGDTPDRTPAKQPRLYHHRHAVKHIQRCEADLAQHLQDSRLFDGQLARSLALILETTGFDSVTNTAFEELFNCTQEYMLDFLATVRASMMSSRRTRPLPQDFIAALARHQARSSSELLEHVKLQLPLFARNQPILAPCPDDAPPANLEGLLGPELSGQGEKAERRYIPKHLPGFPSKHTWQASPVYQERETDPRKIREKATQEGVLAEAALRKLAGKRKQGMMHKNSETGHARIRRTQVDGAKVWEDALQALAEEDAEEKRRNEESGNLALAISLDASQEGASADWAGDAATDEAGLLVNYDRKFWRKGAQGNMASSR